jgi:CRP/FNR family transcriptional regulator
MSLAVSLKNEPAKINAVTELPTVLMLLPVQRVLEWLNEFPEFNLVFYNQFYKRYADLVDTLQQMVFNNLEVRLLEYLRDQASMAAGGVVNMRHRQMAADLGTVREVITRTLKKLEKAGQIRQSKDGIEILVQK